MLGTYKLGMRWELESMHVCVCVFKLSHQQLDKYLLLPGAARVIIQASYCSVHFSIGWLGKFLVGNHLILQANQDCLKRVWRIPWVEHFEAIGDHAVRLINTWNVYFW